MVICDTNIFISVFNDIGNAKTNFINLGSDNILISSITVMELYRGMKNKEQMKQLSKSIEAYNIVDFNEEISELSIDLIHRFRLSHNLDIPDAIIAATCIIYDLPLFTYNIKDFKFIPGIKLYEPIS